MANNLVIDTRWATGVDGDDSKLKWDSEENLLLPTMISPLIEIEIDDLMLDSLNPYDFSEICTESKKFISSLSVAEVSAHIQSVKDSSDYSSVGRGWKFIGMARYPVEDDYKIYGMFERFFTDNGNRERIVGFLSDNITKKEDFDFTKVSNNVVQYGEYPFKYTFTENDQNYGPDIHSDVETPIDAR